MSKIDFKVVNTVDKLELSAVCILMIDMGGFSVVNNQINEALQRGEISKELSNEFKEVFLEANELIKGSDYIISK